MYSRLGRPDKALEVLETHIKEHELAADLTHRNMLAELYMNSAQWRQAFDLIRESVELHCQGTGIPLDFQVQPAALSLSAANKLDRL